MIQVVPLWHAFLFLGPRRGEMCALCWPEVSLTRLTLRISAQVVEVTYCLRKAPKAESVRTLMLSMESGGVLDQQPETQQRKRAEWSGAGA